MRSTHRGPEVGSERAAHRLVRHEVDGGVERQHDGHEQPVPQRARALALHNLTQPVCTEYKTQVVIPSFWVECLSQDADTLTVASCCPIMLWRHPIGCLYWAVFALPQLLPELLGCATAGSIQTQWGDATA